MFSYKYFTLSQRQNQLCKVGLVLCTGTRSLCSEDCFKILDSASASFQLKIKEAMHIL